MHEVYEKSSAFENATHLFLRKSRLTLLIEAASLERRVVRSSSACSQPWRGAAAPRVMHFFIGFQIFVFGVFFSSTRGLCVFAA